MNRGATIRRRCLAILAVAPFVGGAAVWGTVEVNPSIGLSANYTDNIAYTGVVSNNDAAASLGFVLPIRIRRPLMTTLFTLNGTYVKQDTFDSLDRFNWGAGFGLAGASSPRTQLSFSGNYLHTQGQGDPQALDDTEIFLTRRTERDVGVLRLGISQRLSATWNWRGDLSGSRQQSKIIQEFEDQTTPTTLDFEDKDSIGVRMTVTKEFSSVSSVGLSLQQTELMLEDSGDQTTQSASLNYGRKLSSRANMSLSAGGFRNTGEAADGAGTRDESTGISYAANYDRTLRSTAVTIGVGRVPGTGGNLQGTATQTTASLGLSGLDSLYWHWSSSINFGIRESNNIGDPDRQSTALNVRLERLFANQLALSTGTTVVRQTIDGANQADPISFTINVGLVWYPRGRQSAGGS